MNLFVLKANFVQQKTSKVANKRPTRYAWDKQVNDFYLVQRKNLKYWFL